MHQPIQEAKAKNVDQGALPHLPPTTGAFAKLREKAWTSRAGGGRKMERRFAHDKRWRRWCLAHYVVCVFVPHSLSPLGIHLSFVCSAPLLHVFFVYKMAVSSSMSNLWGEILHWAAADNSGVCHPTWSPISVDICRLMAGKPYLRSWRNMAYFSGATISLFGERERWKPKWTGRREKMLET